MCLSQQWKNWLPQHNNHIWCNYSHVCVHRMSLLVSCFHCSQLPNTLCLKTIQIMSYNFCHSKSEISVPVAKAKILAELLYPPERLLQGSVFLVSSFFRWTQSHGQAGFKLVMLLKMTLNIWSPCYYLPNVGLTDFATCLFCLFAFMWYWGCTSCTLPTELYT